MALSASAIVRVILDVEFSGPARYFRFIGRRGIAERHSGFEKLGLEPFVKRMLRTCDTPA
jgi:hypothetical protein